MVQELIIKLLISIHNFTITNIIKSKPLLVILVVILDSSTVNVLLGDVVYVASFNYSITKNGTTKTGFARAEVLAEQHI
jgi:hypothetical protein